MSKKEESKQLATTSQYAVSNDFKNMFDKSIESAGDNMDSKDFRIPKIALVQAMTKADFNTQGAPVGNYINSIDGTDLGNSLDMFVMTDTKLWQFYYEQKKGKDKIEKVYLGTVPYDATNSDMRENLRLPPELQDRFESLELKPEQLLLPDAVLRYFVLLADELREGVAFPYIVDFKRTSYPAGNNLKNICFKMKKLSGVPSYAKVFTLSSEFVQSEYDYWIKKVNGGRPVVQEEVGLIENWIKELQANSNKYAADETEEQAQAYEGETFEAEASSETTAKF